jgi:hypothetical protein
VTSGQQLAYVSVYYARIRDEFCILLDKSRDACTVWVSYGAGSLGVTLLMETDVDWCKGESNVRTRECLKDRQLVEPYPT